MNKRFYITTPIYYPNAEPHLGHVYTTLATDTVARFHRLSGHDTFFLTGTDEHGIKMVKTAEAEKTTPQELVDRNVKKFVEIWRELGVTHDDFIRTSERRHKFAVGEIVNQLVANGDIYLGSYGGWYDEGQEEFVTETEAKANDLKSAVTGKPLTRYTEPSYFFRLKKYVDRVLSHIETNADFIRPESRRNEVISKIKQGVEDLSISRATLKWGIPLPHDPSHVLYVWIDALSNYITALGYASENDAKFKRYWPAEVHLIGKEILWFHTVYWPAMLFALGLEPPRQVFAHGWWTADGRKMSKSLGNFVDLERLRKLCGAYGRDTLRYYILRAAPFGSDLDWSDADFVKAHNELANVVGNGLNRTVNMITRYCGGIVPERPAPEQLDDRDRALLARCDGLGAELTSAYERLELHRCATLPVELARELNAYVDATAPFKLAKDPAQARTLNKVLAIMAVSVQRALVGLLPVLPDKAPLGLAQLGLDCRGKTLAQLLASESDPFGRTIASAGVLFPKVEQA
jgi:methionyl-tRNA synthetase